MNIEVHHILPAAKGGSDNWENAIPLCFDCHSAAGHYNAKHSKGSKYSLEELTGHREKLYADVAAGRVPAADAVAMAGVHVRRLVFLSYIQAREILSGALQSPHFKFGPLIQNAVSKFMQTVLADELPPAPTPAVLAGVARPGVISIDNYWKTRSELAAALPEFQVLDERAVEHGDLRDGAIGSKLLARSVAAGLSATQVGVLKIQHNLCAEETWSVEYRVRRPVFVFTLIENLGTEAISVENVTGVLDAPQGLAPRAVAFPVLGTDKLEITAGVLPPGYSMVVPTALLLSPAVEDDLSFEWVDTQGYGDSVPYVAYSDEQSRLGSDAYLQVGPSFTVTAADILADGNLVKFEAPLFDLKRVYLLGDALMAGSCPHVLLECSDGHVAHLGEVLIGAWKQKKTQVLVMPSHARFLHICEFEFETTTIESIKVGRRSVLGEAVILNCGGVLSVPVEGGEVVEIIGQYDCPLGQSTTAEQRRLKHSLVAGGLRVFAARNRQTAGKCIKIEEVVAT